MKETKKEYIKKRNEKARHLIQAPKHLRPYFTHNPYFFHINYENVSSELAFFFCFFLPFCRPHHSISNHIGNSLYENKQSEILPPQDLR